MRFPSPDELHSNVPDVFTFREERYIKIKDLVKVLDRKKKRARDHGYINALYWVILYLKNMDDTEVQT